MAQSEQPAERGKEANRRMTAPPATCCSAGWMLLPRPGVVYDERDVLTGW